MNTVAKLFGLKPPTSYESHNSVTDVSNPKLLVGMELEIEGLYDGGDAYKALAGAPWNLTTDGSLRPVDASFEFVSKPMFLESAIAELGILLKKLKLTDKNYSDRTSVHVHTNVQDFTQEQLATLCLVYTCLEEPLFLFVNFSGVDKEAYPYGMCRDTNLYCVPWSQCRMNAGLIDKLIFIPGEVPRRWQKYSALNLLPVQEQGTVEWRHMHGTCDTKKLTTWLKLIGNIMQFSKENAFEDVVAALKQLNNVSTYQQFFTSIVGGELPYNDDYRALLAEGCTNAKYSLINWELNKKAGAKVVPVKKRSPLDYFDDEAPAQVVNEEVEAERARARADAEARHQAWVARALAPAGDAAGPQLANPAAARVDRVQPAPRRADARRGGAAAGGPAFRFPR